MRATFLLLVYLLPMLLLELVDFDCVHGAKVLHLSQLLRLQTRSRLPLVLHTLFRPSHKRSQLLNTHVKQQL